MAKLKLELMGEFKGTKGKWESLGGDFDRHINVGKITIAEISSVGVTEDKANALLISEAPEMLSMLEKVNDAILSDSSASLELIKLRHEIESLIKKATEV